MKEKFDEILINVCKEFNKKWYEVFDSNLFYIVEGIIKDSIFNEDYNVMINNQDYKKWYQEMCQEL